MKKTDKPSQHFLGAILRGYDAEAKKAGEVTCAGIWDHVVMECMRERSFNTIFEWDTSKVQNINRIGTIAECIRRGHVPTLSLGKNDKGREVVVKQ